MLSKENIAIDKSKVLHQKSISFKTSKSIYIFNIDNDTLQKYGVTFLQKIETANGLMTLLGEFDNNLWFWPEEEAGGVFHFKPNGNIFTEPQSNRDKVLIFLPSLKKKYPEHLSNQIQNNFGLSPEEVYAIFMEENKLKEDNRLSKKIFSEMNKSVMEMENVEDNLKKEFMANPKRFCQEIIAMIQFLEKESLPQSKKAKLEIKDTTLESLKNLQNALNDLIMNEEKEQNSQQIMQFLINFLITLEFPKDKNAQAEYQTMMMAVGDFVYSNADLMFPNDNNNHEKDIFPLLFFILANANDEYGFKKNCYSNMQNKKGMPFEFNITEDSKKFINMFGFLFNEKSRFRYFLDPHFNSKHPAVKLEYAKLYLSAAVSYSNLNQKDKSEFFVKLAKTILIEILPQESKVIDLLRKFYQQEFDCNVSIAAFYLNNNDKEKASYFLKEAHKQYIYDSNQASYTKSQVIFAKLLLSLGDKEESQKGLQMILNAGSQLNPEAIEYLESKAEKELVIALNLGNWYLKHDKNKEAYKWYLHAASYSSDASYMVYFLQPSNETKKYLFSAAHNGNFSAIQELVEQAELNDVEAAYQLGLIHSNAKQPNNELAIKYLVKAAEKLPEAKFQLASLIVERKIKSDINPVQLLKGLLMSPGKIAIDAFDLLMNVSETYESEQYQISTFLAEILYHGTQGIPQDLKKSAQLTMYCFLVKEEVTDHLRAAFKNPKFLKHCHDTEILAKIFTKIYKESPNSFSDQSLYDIATMLSNGKSQITRSLLLENPLRNFVSSELLVKLFDEAIHNRSKKSEEMASIVIEVMSTREDIGIFIDWLEKNKAICSVILNNEDMCESLSWHKQWQSFINKTRHLDVMNKNSAQVPSFFFSQSKGEKSNDANNQVTKLIDKISEFMQFLSKDNAEDIPKYNALRDLCESLKNEKVVDMQFIVEYLRSIDPYFNSLSNGPTNA